MKEKRFVHKLETRSYSFIHSFFSQSKSEAKQNKISHGRSKMKTIPYFQHFHKTTNSNTQVRDYNESPKAGPILRNNLF
jgi:hypothetical protein